MMHWTLSVLLIVLLFILIFGFLGAFIIRGGVYHAPILGFLVGASGSIIVIVALFKPRSPVSPILEKSHLATQHPFKEIPIGSVVIGFSFLLGGLVHTFTNSTLALVLCLSFPVFYSFVGRFFTEMNDED